MKYGQTKTTQSECERLVYWNKQSSTPTINIANIVTQSDDVSETGSIYNDCVVTASISASQSELRESESQELKEKAEDQSEGKIDETVGSEIEIDEKNVLSMEATLSTVSLNSYEEDTKVQDLFIAKEYEKCLSMIADVASRIGSLCEQLKLIKARCLIAMDDFNTAQEILERVIEKNPRELDAMDSLSECFFLQGELFLAITTCDAILGMEPTHKLALRRKESAETYRNTLSDAVQFYAKRKYKNMIEILSNVVDVDCESKIVTSAILSNRGMAWKQLKGFKRALKDFNDAQQLCPGNKTIHEKRAICFYKTKNFADCVNDCEEALKLRPSNTVKKLREASLKKIRAMKQRSSFDGV